MPPGPTMPPTNLPTDLQEFWAGLVQTNEEEIRAKLKVYGRTKRPFVDLYLNRLEQQRTETRELSHREAAADDARLSRRTLWWGIGIAAVVALVAALIGL